MKKISLLAVIVASINLVAFCNEQDCFPVSKKIQTVNPFQFKEGLEQSTNEESPLYVWAFYSDGCWYLGVLVVDSTNGSSWWYPIAPHG